MSQSLGKRKERDVEKVEPGTHGSTVFVSNLPYTATSTDIKTLFSDIGPVRSAFVVLDPESGASKGVGYVAFAIREDAQAAYDTVNGGNGLAIDGRKLRVDWAGNKPHKDAKDRTEKISPENKPVKPARPPKRAAVAGPSDPLAIRTIVISGLPSGVDSKALWKKVRKYDGAEKVEWPVSINGSEDASTAHVLFSNPSTAQEAVNRLHAHVFKGALLSVTLKKRLDGLAKVFSKMRTTPKTSTSADATESGKTKSAGLAPAPSRSSRLIVRNLPFEITEQDLRAVFLPYGPIHSVHIPLETVKVEPTADAEDDEEVQTKPAVATKPRTKGYAFVWMLSKKDAEKALEGANGTRVYAGMADGMVKDKQKRKKLRREEAKIKLREKERKAKRAVKEEDGDAEAGDEKKEDEDEEDEDANEEVEESEADEDGPTAERVIAVDWALSKDKWVETKAKLQEEADTIEDVKEESDEESDDDSEDDDSSGDSHVGLHDHSDGESGSDDEDGSDDEMDLDEQPVKPQLPATDVGTTLFVRNVPFEATDDELRTVFRAFGSLRYARITMDHDLGRSRGTGFVCFWNKEDADKVIEQSDILRQETMGSAPPTLKKNPFKLPSLLTADPSASIAQNLVLQGRTLDVIRAVTRDQAGKLKEAGEKQREKADKRHLYLLREGLIMPNTPAAEGLSTAEVEKRTQSLNSRKALLRSNPSLYVSRTRLSIRQIPLFVTERTLKHLAVHAVRAFERDVKAGTRSPLTEDELANPPADPDEVQEQPQTKEKPKKPYKSGRSTGVKQTKIVRQQDRVDPVTGKGRSRGYGFLEMETHADALRVLRWANNNPEVAKLFDEWRTEELQDLLKAEKKKENREEGRLERIKAEIEQGAHKKSKGTLIAEFSIENVQVVKRRDARQHDQQNPPPEEKKEKRSKTEVKREQSEIGTPASKKQRTSGPAEVKQEKGGNQMGSLIGRKRKERRAKKRT